MTDDLGRRLDQQSELHRDKERNQDRRADRQRQHREWLENSRTLNRAKEEQQKTANRATEYAQKRQDAVADMSEKSAVSRDEQEEITHREQMLQIIGASIYRDNLNADFDHLVNVKNIEVQEHGLITEMDTRNRVAIDNNTARNARREIREHTKAYIRERLTDFYLAEAAKATAQQNVERTIEAESSAHIREKWAENDVRKDFEIFMAELTKKTGAWKTEEIENVLRKLDA